MSILLLIVGVLLFIGLVVVHEYGHFVVARRNGVEVEEFGIGFPPKIWGKRIRPKAAKASARTDARRDFLFSLNWLPLGGFVRLKGEHDSDTEPGTFGAASTWAKTKIMAAGVGMNLLAAFVLFTVVALIGMPKVLDQQFTVAADTKIIKDVENKGVVKIDQVVKGSPAATAGVTPGSQIISVAGTAVTNPEQLAAVTKRHAGETVAVVMKQSGHQATVQARLNGSSPYLGVASSSAETGFQIRRSSWSAPVVAIGVMRDFTIATFQGLGTALKGLGSIIAGLASGNTAARQTGQSQASSQVSGPVGIFAVLYEGAHMGIGFVLFVEAIISLSLAIMNLLPIPALDGGKVFVTGIARLFRRRVSERVEDYVYGASFVFLLALIALITVVDVKRFF